MWIVPWLIVALRCLLVPLAAYVLWRSKSGPVELWKGSPSLTQHNRSQVFFFALAVILSQTFYLAVPSPPLLLLALLLSATSLILSASFFYRKKHMGLGDITPMLDHPDLSLPLVQLAELDPDAAEALAQQARRLLAERKAHL